MAEGGPEPLWDVIVECGDVSMKRLYILPVSTTIEEIQRQWTEEVGLEPGCGAFVTSEGVLIDGERRLGDMEEVAPGLEIVKLNFFEEDNIPIQVYGGLYSSPKFRTRLSQPPDTLFPDIRRIFHAAEETDFRLWSLRGLLQNRVPLAKQGVSENTPLMVELALDFEFLEPWDGLVVCMEGIFASENCEDVLTQVMEAIEDQTELSDGSGDDGESGSDSEEEEAEEEEEEEFQEIDDYDSDNLCDLLDEEDGRPQEEGADEEDTTDDYQSVEGFTAGELAAAQQSILDEADLRVMLDRSEVIFRGEVLDALTVFGAPWMRFFALRLESRRTLAVLAGSSLTLVDAWPGDSVRHVVSAAAVMFGDRMLSGHEALCDLNVPRLGVFVADPLVFGLRLSSGACVTVRVPAVATVGDVRDIAACLEKRPHVLLRRGRRWMDEDEATLVEAGVAPDCVVQVVRNTQVICVTVGGRDVAFTPDTRRIGFTDVVNQLLARTPIPYRALYKKVFRCLGCGRRISRDQEAHQAIPAACCDVRSCRLAECSPEPAAVSHGLSATQMQLTWRVKELEVKVKALERENAELAVKSRKATKLLNSLREEVEKLRTENGFLRADKESLEGQVEELRAFGDKVMSHSSSLEERVEELQKSATLQRLPFRIVNWCPDFNGGDNFDVELTLCARPTVGEFRRAICAYMRRTPSSTTLRRDVGQYRGQTVYDVGPENRFIYADAVGNVRDEKLVTNKRRKQLNVDSDPLPVVPGRRNSLWVLTR